MRRQQSLVHHALCGAWTWLCRKLRPLFACGIQFRALFLCFHHTGSSLPYTFLIDSFLAVSLTQRWVRLIPQFPSKPFISVSLQAVKVISLVQIQHRFPVWDFPVGGVRLLGSSLQSWVAEALPNFPRRQKNILFGKITISKFSPVLSLMFLKTEAVVISEVRRTFCCFSYC